MFNRILGRRAASHNARRVKRKPAIETLEGRQLMSLGAEFVIAQPINCGAQIQGANASSSYGSSVAVWESINNGTSQIAGQIFYAKGGTVGPVLSLASEAGVDEEQPSVAMDAHGNFVVSWTEEFLPSGHTDILAQKFTSAGAPVGAVVPVAVGTFAQTDSSVAMDAKGDLVVSYTRNTNNNHDDIFAKLYNTNGQLETVVNAADSFLNGDFSSVAMTPDGRFDVAWLAEFSNVSNQLIVNRYSASGAFIGNARPATGTNGAPKIAMDNQGNAVVVYSSSSLTATEVEAARISNTGAVGPLINITSPPLADETSPTVALEGSRGAFVVAYQDLNGVSVAVVNRSNEVIGRFSAGQSRVTPAISINGQNGFLVSYNVFNGQSSIAGRRGLL